MKVSVLAVFAAVAGLGSALDAVLDPTSHADHDTDQHHGALEHRVLETAASSDMVSATQQPPTKRDATIVGPGEVKWTNTYPTTMVDLDAGVGAHIPLDDKDPGVFQKQIAQAIAPARDKKFLDKTSSLVVEELHTTDDIHSAVEAAGTGRTMQHVPQHEVRPDQQSSWQLEGASLSPVLAQQPKISPEDKFSVKPGELKWIAREDPTTIIDLTGGVAIFFFGQTGRVAAHISVDQSDAVLQDQLRRTTAMARAKGCLRGRLLLPDSSRLMEAVSTAANNVSRHWNHEYYTADSARPWFFKVEPGSDRATAGREYSDEELTVHPGNVTWLPRSKHIMVESVDDAHQSGMVLFLFGLEGRVAAYPTGTRKQIIKDVMAACYLARMHGPVVKVWVRLSESNVEVYDHEIETMIQHLNMARPNTTRTVEDWNARPRLSDGCAWVYFVHGSSNEVIVGQAKNSKLLDEGSSSSSSSSHQRTRLTKRWRPPNEKLTDRVGPGEIRNANDPNKPNVHIGPIDGHTDAVLIFWGPGMRGDRLVAFLAGMQNDLLALISELEHAWEEAIIAQTLHHIDYYVPVDVGVREAVERFLQSKRNYGTPPLPIREIRPAAYLTRQQISHAVTSLGIIRLFTRDRTRLTLTWYWPDGNVKGLAWLMVAKPTAVMGSSYYLTQDPEDLYLTTPGVTVASQATTIRVAASGIVLFFFAPDKGRTVAVLTARKKKKVINKENKRVLVKAIKKAMDNWCIESIKIYAATAQEVEQTAQAIETSAIYPPSPLNNNRSPLIEKSFYSLGNLDDIKQMVLYVPAGSDSVTTSTEPLENDKMDLVPANVLIVQPNTIKFSSKHRQVLIPHVNRFTDTAIFFFAWRSDRLVGLFRTEKVDELLDKLKTASQHAVLQECTYSFRVYASNPAFADAVRTWFKTDTTIEWGKTNGYKPIFSVSLALAEGAVEEPHGKFRFFFEVEPGRKNIILRKELARPPTVPDSDSETTLEGLKVPRGEVLHGPGSQEVVVEAGTTVIFFFGMDAGRVVANLPPDSNAEWAEVIRNACEMAEALHCRSRIVLYARSALAGVWALENIRFFGALGSTLFDTQGPELQMTTYSVPGEEGEPNSGLDESSGSSRTIFFVLPGSTQPHYQVSRDRWYRTKTVSEHRAKRPRPNDHEAGPSNPPRALEMRAATTTVEPGQVHHVEKSAGIAADHVDRAKGTVIFFLGEAGRVVASLTGNGTAFAGQLRAAGQTAAQHACTQRVVLYAPDDQQEDAVRKYLGSGDFPHSPGVVPRIESIAPSLGPQPDRAPSHLLLWLAAGSGEVEITGRTVSGPDDEGPPDTETQIQHGEIDTTRPAMCLSPNAELRSRESPCDR